MEKKGFERTLDFDDARLARDLFGPQGDYLARVARRTGTRLESRGGKLRIAADAAEDMDLAANVLVQLYGQLKAGQPLFPGDVDNALSILCRQPSASIKEVFTDELFVVSKKKTVGPKTLGQREYVLAVRDNDLTFGIGPAGTGKTYLAVAMAVKSLLAHECKRLILTRPAVEAGEHLGFLPGDMVEKVNPYLRPLYDALHDMLDFRKVQEMLEEGVIEIAPLAFMRGRTLNNSFIILDEAQNTTPEQMKMFLTRLGFGSKAVVTGDITQIDLPGSSRAGLIQAETILSGVDGVGFVHFKEDDVIRHPLVGRIVQAYERYEEGQKKKR